MWLLTQTLPGTDRSVFAALRETAATPTIRVWATSAPFEAKDELRTHGYRWMPADRDGIPRSWWTDVAPPHLESEFGSPTSTARTAGFSTRPACRNDRSPPATAGVPTRSNSAREPQPRRGCPRDPPRNADHRRAGRRAARPGHRDRALVSGGRTRRVPRPDRHHSRPHRGHP